MAENEENENWVKERWLYLGRFWIDRTKEGDKFQVINDETGEVIPDEIKEFNKIKSKSFTIGSVYEIEVLHKDDNGLSIRASAATRLRVYHDQDFVNLLMAKEKVFKEQKREHSLQKKYNSGFDVPEDFHEIQKIYNKLNYTDRRVFERLIMAKLEDNREKYLQWERLKKK